MRTLLVTLFAFAVPFTLAAEEETASASPEILVPEPDFPEQMTPEALAEMADRLEELSRQRLVAGQGGRKTAEARHSSAVQTEALAIRLHEAATSLETALATKSEAEAVLDAAEGKALTAARNAANEVGDLELSRELADLYAAPEELPPAPKTHVFCMEASGAGPRTFARFARESLTEALPYVQGYIAHELEQVAPYKLRLRLIVEHDADAAPFATIDALHAANKAAVSEMNDNNRRPAETILMDDLAERLCASTPVNPSRAAPG